MQRNLGHVEIYTLTIYIFTSFALKGDNLKARDLNCVIDNYAVFRLRVEIEKSFQHFSSI